MEKIQSIFVNKFDKIKVEPRYRFLLEQKYNPIFRDLNESYKNGELNKSDYDKLWGYISKEYFKEKMAFFVEGRLNKSIERFFNRKKN